MAVPTSDTGLRDYGANFGTRVTATPTAYNLTAAQATAFDGKYDPFIIALDAVAAERAAGIRSGPQTEVKDEAKRQLLLIARELYAFVQDSLSVSDAKKLELGVVVKDFSPTPTPAPGFAPEILVKKVVGRTVTVQLKDAQNAARRGRPPGVIGASVFSFVGATPPSDISLYKFEGNTGRTTVNIEFPSSTPAGGTVFITGFWFNPAKLSGPACPPVGTTLAGGSVSMAA